MVDCAHAGDGGTTQGTQVRLMGNQVAGGAGGQWDYIYGGGS